MKHSYTCPECGSTRIGHHHDSVDAVSQGAGDETRFAHVLNGLHWREKPLAEPKYRDDVVPND
jgi:hypothetical protein